MLAKFVIFFTLPVALAIAHAGDISKASRLMAECEFIYSYVGQTMQLQNNQGAALNLLRRSSLMITANMFSSQSDGKIPAETIRQWAALRDPIKRKLESGALSPIDEVQRCDREAHPVAVSIRERASTLWGRTFDELHDGAFDRLKRSVGL